MALALGAPLALFLAGAGGHPPGPDVALIAGDSLPPKLSAFGLFRAGSHQFAQGVEPYRLRTALFSDYADKTRGIWLPPGGAVTHDPDGKLAFPLGTVLIKSFGWPDHAGGAPVETRLLIHRAGGWAALPFIWDADGRDATLVRGGRRVPVQFAAPDGTAQSIRYAVPNQNQCKDCHSLGGAIVPIGPKLANLDMGDGHGPLARQLRSAQAATSLMPRWDDAASGTVAQRARAYIDVNCAHCHNPAGSASNSGLFLRWTDDPASPAYGINKRPVAAGRGSGGRLFAIAPGDPDASIALYRMDSIEAGVAMPELGRATVHREGADLLRQWIAQMPKAAH